MTVFITHINIDAEFRMANDSGLGVIDEKMSAGIEM